MRISTSLSSFINASNARRLESAINKQLEQLNTGSKVNNSYDNASLFSDDLRLDYEKASFRQVIEASNRAVEFTKNSDNAIKDIKKDLDSFKTKLVQAATAEHDITSLNAIANDLQSIRDHIKQTLNTSINGQFLFSGTSVNTRPFNDNGDYVGNKENMKVVLGSGVKSEYNISGYELALGKDNEYKKVVSTNVRLTDNRYGTSPDEIKFLKENDKIKQLIGNGYLAPNADPKLDPNEDYGTGANKYDFPNTYFYIRGVSPDGTSFRSKFSMGPEENISALLEKIGESFGNTKENKIVEVSLSNTGNIEVKSLKQGHPSLDFSMFAATPHADMKENITDTFVGNSPADVWDPNTLRQAGQNVTITNFNKTNKNDINGIDDFIDYDRYEFNKKDNVLYSNQSQLLKDGTVATNETKLSQVALSDMTNTTLKMQITSKSQVAYDVSIDLATSRVNATYTDVNGVRQQVDFPIIHTEYDEHDHLAHGVPTPPNEISYRQLGDIAALFANDNLPADYPVDPNTGRIDDNDLRAYEELLGKAKFKIDSGLDSEGRFYIKDKNATTTSIKFAMYDDSAMGPREFEIDPNNPNIREGKRAGSAFVFNTNSSIVLDTPKIDLLKDLDEMIEAVRTGMYRPDDDKKQVLENGGIQGAILRLDHIYDHVNKINTKLGSVQNSITSTRDRAEIMEVEIESVRAELVGADPAEVFYKLNQYSLCYQATLQASAKISQLTLLNYI